MWLRLFKENKEAFCQLQWVEEKLGSRLWDKKFSVTKKAREFQLDLAWWRDHQTTQALFELTKEHHQHVYGDQGILNHYFKDAWLRLPLTYNLQVGSDKDQHQYGDLALYDEFPGLPAVIHYTSHNKPWIANRFNHFREIWWFYYALSWEDALFHLGKM